MTSTWVRSSGWPVSKVCSARADATTYITNPQGPLVLCQSMSEGSASLSNGAFVTRYGVHNPLLLVQWYWVFGQVHQHVVEGAQWMKDHLDIQLCEDP